MKKVKLVALLLAAVMAFGVAGCGGDTEDTSANNEETTAQVEEEIKDDAGDKEAAGHSDFVGSETYNAIEQIVSENMGDYKPELSYDEENNILYLNLTAPEGTAAAIEAGFDENTKTAWDNMVASFLDLTKTGDETLTAAGYEDISFALMLLSDANSERGLYAAIDGTAVYDVANDIGTEE